mmetsp:Transcript_19138/g.42784  ORF Transcript_19138/g.42784 Transcript_19138/m.42784 type:complete len:263 (-) Transcript_19138:1962-2750(-)
MRPAMQRTAQPEKTPTEKPRSPAGTAKPTGMSGRYHGSASYLVRQAPSSFAPLVDQYSAAKNQGIPRPRKTLTELEPVMFTMEASAKGSFSAAVFEANVSGIEVPSATNVMAVTEGISPRQQPICEAMSLMRAVSIPIIASETMKHSQPPPRAGGGVSAPKSFHGSAITNIMKENAVVPSKVSASENCAHQLSCARSTSPPPPPAISSSWAILSTSFCRRGSGRIRTLAEVDERWCLDLPLSMIFAPPYASVRMSAKSRDPS